MSRKSWWGKRFIEAIERFTDPGRLSRGRSYASDHRIKSLTLSPCRVEAKIRGNINAYFGVTKEPTYQTEIQLVEIPQTTWSRVILAVSKRAGYISQLLMQELPEDIDILFPKETPLLPVSQKDFKVTRCSCPDYANPCKHIAGLYYRLGNMIDKDPLLLFELRGLPREQLLTELRKTPLGQVLAEAVDMPPPSLNPTEHYYTLPVMIPLPESISFERFWQGEKRVPNDVPSLSPATVPAVLIKKGGDFPSFWHRDNSFLDAMEELYQRVRKNV